ncbi:transcription elongation factor GreA [Lachnospiraceae bacterium A10]|jgi:transcription elongation factor GreA|nr:transcription elongation factor GreA [Lachnospiraceae bacterium A10]
MGERLTESDIAKIEKEIRYRKLELRPILIENLKEARSHGDLSENFEYYAAKRDKNINESRIRYLDRMLRTSTVVEDTSAEDEVGLDDTVMFYILEDEEEDTVKITTSIRSDSMNGRVSIESPLGKALLNHKVGDIVTVPVNSEYSYDVEIRAILKSEDEDEDIKSF